MYQSYLIVQADHPATSLADLRGGTHAHSDPDSNMPRGRRSALVEDDEIMGGSIAQRLVLEGAEVIWLKLAQRAIGALRTPRAPIDAVISDIRLPDGTGKEVFTTFCRTMSPPPFLFISGQGGIEQAVRLLHAGAADYITKPFEIGPFPARLNLLLRPRATEGGRAVI